MPTLNFLLYLDTPQIPPTPYKRNASLLSIPTSVSLPCLPKHWQWNRQSEDSKIDGYHKIVRDLNQTFEGQKKKSIESKP